MALFLSCAWLAIVIWLLVRAFAQRGLLRVLEPVAPPVPARAPRIALIVPARDEAANIERCLSGLLRQTYPGRSLRIIVVDDHSSDGTFAIAAVLATHFPCLTVLRSPPLPPHWIGKSHACWIAAQSIAGDVEWLCFVDADVRAEPALVASALEHAGAAGLDLLSLAPRQEFESVAERLVMPCGFYLLGFCQDLRQVQARDGRDVTATGQFMLVRRDVYDEVGGHRAVRGAICEDLMLARLVKQAGHRVELADGRRLVATRMYSGWATLWIGIAKNLVEMLQGRTRTLLIALAAVLLAWAAWLVPMLDAVGCAGQSRGACVALVPALIASASAFGLHIAGALYFRIPLWYGLVFPLGYTVGAAIAVDSVRRRWRGRVRWKGRTYP